MRDLIFTAYIAIWIILTWSVKRLPFWTPRIVRVGNAGFISDQRPAGCMMVLFLVMGAGIGVTLPMALSDFLPHDPYQFRRGGVADLDGIGRLAVVVGGLCGGYVGLRGSWLWVIFLLAGVALYFALATLRWVIGVI